MKRQGFSVATPQPLVFNRGKPDEAVVHRVSTLQGEEHLILDLIVVTPNLESVWQHRENRTWEGRALWVVSRTGLAQMKRMAGRKQDLADLERLEKA